MAEVCAEQPLPFRGRFLTGGQTMLHLCEPALKELLGPRVPLAKFGAHLFPQGMDFAFGQSHDQSADGARPFVVREEKGAEQHALSIRLQDQIGAQNRDGFQNEMSGTRLVQNRDVVSHQLHFGE